MPLPNIDIQFDNGTLGAFAPSPDGLLALVVHIEPTVAMPLLTPKLITGMADLAQLGILDNIDNHVAFKAIKEFYDEAGEGTQLWLFGVAKDTNLSTVFSPVDGVRPIETLLKTANGNIRGLLFAYNMAANLDVLDPAEIEDGLFGDVWVLANAAQTFAENFTSSNKAPFFCVVDGYGFVGDHTLLPNMNEAEYNRVMILLGDTETRSGATASLGSAIGIVGGRIAKNAVHVNIGRVSDGAVNALNVYILDDQIEQYNVEAIHDKGFVSFRKWVGRSGAYFTDDRMACAISDDYAQLTQRRVIDKAFRIAYNTLVDTMLGQVPVNNDGTIQVPFAKNIENRVESAIFNQMSALGELSVDVTNPNDRAVRFTIDLTNNVVASSNINGTLRVRPFGYNRFFDILLGFNINSNN